MLHHATTRLLALSLLLTLGLTFIARAYHLRPGHRPGADSPLSQEIRAYVQANVLPTLRQQRLKLEPQLAPADQVALAGYRAQLRELRTQGQALRARVQPAEGSTRPTLTPEQRQQAHALHTQTRDILWQVSELARKYQSNLEQLAAEVQPQRDRWATDLKAIVAKSATPEQQQYLSRWQGFATQHRALKRALSADAFLLLDPNAPADAPGLGGSSLYPSPATTTAQLQYEVRKSGPVTVELLDTKGQPLRQLLPTTAQEKGTYTQALDLRDLPNGTYFYKVTTKAGTETKRFVKE